MPDMALIGGLANSLNVALNIAKAMLGIRDQALIGEKVVELTSVIIEAQQAQSGLAARVGELEAELMRMKDWEADKQRYELRQLSPLGTYAYVTKETMTGAEPPHSICAACYANGKKSILQAMPELQNGRRTLLCPECKNTIMTGG